MLEILGRRPIGDVATVEERMNAKPGDTVERRAIDQLVQMRLVRMDVSVGEQPDEMERTS